MKKNDKNIENLIDRMMAETTLESASIDFTSKIMSQVSVVEKSKIKAYSPLISKSTWIFIGICLITLTIYSVYAGNNISSFKIVDLYSDKASSLFSSIHFSRNILYAILIVPFMILIQIGLLKNYFDKKYQL